MATTRLRKAFRYPEEEDVADPVEGVDEEEQEKLISRLATEDAQKTALYTKIFLAFPLLATVPYLLALVSFSTTSSQSLRAVLSISSLLCTAYTLAYLPLPPRSADKSFITDFALQLEPSGPIDRYLVPLNAILTGVVGGGAMLVSWNAEGGSDFVKAGLPVWVLGVVLLVRTQLRPVNVSELAKLKYNYKGA